jgi:hypothetical protein
VSVGLVPFLFAAGIAVCHFVIAISFGRWVKSLCTITGVQRYVILLLLPKHKLNALWSKNESAKVET